VSLLVKKLALLPAIVFLVSALTGLSLAAPLSLEEKQRLEGQLRELDKQIGETEGIVSQYREQGKTLKQEIDIFNKDIHKTNLQIKAVGLTINKLDGEIGENEREVKITETKLVGSREGLRGALQTIYEQESQTVVEILLHSPSIAHFFSGINDLLAVQENLQISLNKAVTARNQLLDEQEDLALRRADQEHLRLSRDSQKRELEGKKKNKKELLDVTRGQESKYQEILDISRKTAAQIRNRIFEFLGGGQLTFEQAYQLAKNAADLAGLRPALILAVLDKESALGRNVGQCNYKEVMHPRRDLPLFLEIVNELGVSPDSVTVSCPIGYDGAYGGAMGPAQFIPSTWKIYKEQIASLSGSHPPSPWRNLDAFIGTALYLKDAYHSSACVSYGQEIPDQAQSLQERCAAARYYAGKRWHRYRWTYGERVLNKARQFEEDIRQIIS